MFVSQDFISGEKFQNLCDAFCGTEEFLLYNPKFVFQTDKHIYLDKLTSEWDNPRFLFCFTACLPLFQEKLLFFKNPFVLISHNCDNIITDSFQSLADHPLLLKWFAQNLQYDHPKLHWLPIGIANDMWPHGSLEALQYVLDFSHSISKEKDIYFFFALHTNEKERKSCKKILQEKGLVFGEVKPFVYYLQDLASHKFCISPPGNGVDCHRIWESFYFGTVPILLRTKFTETISTYFPCILLTSWEELDEKTILASYDSSWRTQAQSSPFLRFNYWKQLILDAGHLPE